LTGQGQVKVKIKVKVKVKVMSHISDLDFGLDMTKMYLMIFDL